MDEFDWILSGAKTQEPYLVGPPRLVEAAPAPGQDYAPLTGPASATVIFSDNVSASSSAFVVNGPAGAVTFGYAYSPGTFTATLDFGAALPPGDYTIIVGPGVTAGGLALDGEIADPESPASLPSGDGLAGGNAAFAFHVQRCPGDFDGDGFITGDDMTAFVIAFETGDPRADFDGDGFITGDDYTFFTIAFETGC